MAEPRKIELDHTRENFWETYFESTETDASTIISQACDHIYEEAEQKIEKKYPEKWDSFVKYYRARDARSSGGLEPESWGIFYEISGEDFHSELQPIIIGEFIEILMKDKSKSVLDCEYQNIAYFKTYGFKKIIEESVNSIVDLFGKSERYWEEEQA